MVLQRVNGKIYRPVPKEGIGSKDYSKIEEILADNGLMKKLVEEDPTEAIRIFNIREHIGLGEMICEEYQFDLEYRGTVRDIKSRMKDILFDSTSQ